MFNGTYTSLPAGTIYFVPKPPTPSITHWARSRSVHTTYPFVRCGLILHYRSASPRAHTTSASLALPLAALRLRFLSGSYPSTKRKGHPSGWPFLVGGERGIPGASRLFHCSLWAHPSLPFGFTSRSHNLRLACSATGSASASVPFGFVSLHQKKRPPVWVALSCWRRERDSRRFAPVSLFAVGSSFTTVRLHLTLTQPPPRLLCHWQRFGFGSFRVRIPPPKEKATRLGGPFLLAEREGFPALRACFTVRCGLILHYRSASPHAHTTSASLALPLAALRLRFLSGSYPSTKRKGHPSGWPFLVGGERGIPGASRLFHCSLWAHPSLPFGFTSRSHNLRLACSATGSASASVPFGFVSLHQKKRPPVWVALSCWRRERDSRRFAPVSLFAVGSSFTTVRLHLTLTQPPPRLLCHWQRFGFGSFRVRIPPPKEKATRLGGPFLLAEREGFPALRACFTVRCGLILHYRSASPHAHTTSASLALPLAALRLRFLSGSYPSTKRKGHPSGWPFLVGGERGIPGASRLFHCSLWAHPSLPFGFTSRSHNLRLACSATGSASASVPFGFVSLHQKKRPPVWVALSCWRRERDSRRFAPVSLFAVGSSFTTVRLHLTLTQPPPRLLCHWQRFGFGSFRVRIPPPKKRPPVWVALSCWRRERDSRRFAPVSLFAVGSSFTTVRLHLTLTQPPPRLLCHWQRFGFGSFRVRIPPPKEKATRLGGPFLLAEREGFEPSVPVRVHTISSRAPSTDSAISP